MFGIADNRVHMPVSEKTQQPLFTVRSSRSGMHYDADGKKRKINNPDAEHSSKLYIRV